MGPLAWELPYAAGMALKSKKKKKYNAKLGSVFLALSWGELMNQ